MRALVPLSAVSLLALLAGCDAGAPPRSEQPSRSAGWDAPEEPSAAVAPSPDTGSASPPAEASLPPAAPPPAALTGSRDAPPSVEVTGPSREAREPLPVGARGLLPLARVLQIATAAVPGDVIEVDLDHDDDDDDDIPEYELEILTPQGRTIEMKIDARRGTILEIEED